MSIDEVRSLVAERQRYDDWLTALDARRAETPGRVFERVRGDYVARRDAVMAQLGDHVGALSAHAEALSGRFEALETELAALEDERVEAMLRTAVGEYDDHRWDAVRQDVEGKLATLGEQRSGLLSEIDEIRTLLASARSEPRASVVDAPAEPVVVQDAATEAPVADEGVAEEVVADEGVADEVVADEGMVELTVDTPDLAAIEVAEPMGDQRVTEFDDALAMFSDTPTTPDATFIRSLEGIEVEHDGQGASSMSAPALPAAPPATAVPVDIDETFDDLAFLRSVIEPTPASSSPAVSSVPPVVPPPAPPSTAAHEPLKTLRCTECGTMNLPTEWYCERCGGELAAF